MRAAVWPADARPVRRLRPGSRVAIVSPSNGLAPLFPAVYERGLEALRALGLEPVPFPSAGRTTEELYGDPAARVADIHAALADETIHGIIATIGGYESVRLLPLFDSARFRRNPKLILGGSDATTYTLFARRAGVVSFYGPSVMAGFSQADDLPKEFLEHVRSFLFGTWDRYRYTPYPHFTHGYTDWSKESRGRIGTLHENGDGPKVLQGQQPVIGHLWGGCIEVIEFLKGTRFWPPVSFFDSSVLFFETSEEKPSPDRVGYMLRNYGVAGILHRAAAILFGRPKDYSAQEQDRLEELVVRIVRDEFGLSQLPILTRTDIGHTDPKWIFPIGAQAKIDPADRRVEILSPPFE